MPRLTDRAAAEALFDRLSALLAEIAPPSPPVPRPTCGWQALCARIPG